MKDASALVWFKRDLRVHDHAVLCEAQTYRATAAIFVIEPQWLQSDECDSSHVDFSLACVAELRKALAERGVPLLVRVGSILEVFQGLLAQHPFSHLLSHEETGSGWSYRRDLQVAAWCRTQQVEWQEFSQTGAVRRLRSRFGWANQWQARMASPLHLLRGGFNLESDVARGLCLGAIPTLNDLGLIPHGKTLQAAGERAARQTLQSFLVSRGSDYRKALSSPLTAFAGCSRLSPHLAFGTISMRTVHQATEVQIARAQENQHPNDRALANGLTGFSSRLRWHCHFVQKLESEPAIEFRNFSRVYDGLRPGDLHGGAAPFSDADEANFEAWCQGRTGYPMVDACMRSLRATGWLNFRMRAMLVSFASYHLWLHWREPGLFLARQFLDFEPGIHWSQMQMQSGTTGINTLRIYSPTKQAQDHDPQGYFIRRWVPELGRVPLPYLAEPWKMDISVQRMAGCRIGTDYPAPVVNEKAALTSAKNILYGLRQRDDARTEAIGVQAKHGSRKSGLPNSTPQKKRRPSARNTMHSEPSTQGDLFA